MLHLCTKFEVRRHSRSEDMTTCLRRQGMLLPLYIFYFYTKFNIVPVCSADVVESHRVRRQMPCFLLLTVSEHVLWSCGSRVILFAVGEDLYNELQSKRNVRGEFALRIKHTNAAAAK